MTFSLINDVTVVAVVFVLSRAWDKGKSVGPPLGFNPLTLRTLPQSHRDLMLSWLKCDTSPVYCSSFVISPTTSFYNSFRFQNLAFFYFYLSRWNFIIGADLMLAELTTEFFCYSLGGIRITKFTCDMPPVNCVSLVGKIKFHQGSPFP